MEVSDDSKQVAAQAPDGEPEPAQPPVIEPDRPVPAEEPPVPTPTPDAPVEEPPEEPSREDVPVEEPPDRHEQEAPIQEPPDAPAPMSLEGADTAAEEAVEPEPEPAQVMDAEELMAGQSAEQASEAAVDESNLRAVVEAIIYITEEPLTLEQIATALEQPRERVHQALTQILEASADAGRGITVREVAGGYKMGTKPEHHEAIRTFVKKLKPPLKLSLAALETLAVIAYKQPITGPEIMEVRGVQGAGVIKTLLDRKLIAPAGRKQVVGKPILYKTTKDFLLQFGLKDLSELPTLKEFEELRRLAFSDDDAVAEPVRPAATAPQAPAAEQQPEPERETPRASAHEAGAAASE